MTFQVPAKTQHRRRRALKKTWICQVCSKEYLRKDAYKKHIEIHETRFICDVCGRICRDRRYLISHLFFHGLGKRKKRYDCKPCELTYCEERLLIKHIRKNHYNFQNKEPNFLRKQINDTWIEKVKDTNICVKITKVNENVLTIKRTNVDCVVIDNDVEVKEIVYPHMSVTKVKCSYCNKEMLKKSLYNHIRELHSNACKFYCKVCKLGFKRRYQLTVHNCGRSRRKEKKI